MKERYSFGILLVALSSCGPQRQPQQPATNTEEPALPAPSAPPAATQGTPAPSPIDNNEAQSLPKKILLEPKGPIDPKSVEAAGQVVQHYGALIEQGRLAEAAKLWADGGSADKFARQLRRGTHMEIGDLGDTEGAAGSIYTTVPVTFYGDGFRKAASVILRRVNDVPGSTEAQRRWHIERIDWAKAP